MKFREFVELTKDAIEGLAAGTRDGRDLTPMLHLESQDGISLLALDPAFFTSASTREVLAHRVAVPAIREYRARKVAWTFTGIVHGEQSWEALFATFVDAERTEVWVAPIVRPENLPPVIGSWESWPDTDGPLLTTIQETLR